MRSGRRDNETMDLLGPKTRDDDKPAMRWFPVYAGLRDAIVSHRLAPGTKLPEDELASIYSVSRAVIRAALQALSHDRLARLEPNRGAFVAQPTKQEAREVFEARALIEPKVAALAAEVAKSAEIAQLRLHLKKEHEALHAGRDSDAIMLSAKFHVGIAQIAGHSILTLVDAIEKHDAKDASDLMRSHLVDLLSGLDLSLGEKKPESLSDILR
jgi:DNA-binding GntR family transcriptional regulator